MTISDTFRITPGGLAKGFPRSQKRVFFGDLLTFEATGPKGVVIHDGWVSGRVLGEELSTDKIITGQRMEISVRVGQMGEPSEELGKPPALVTAVPQVDFSAAGFQKSVSKPFAFKVVADLVWLADRASTAGEEGDLAYLAVIEPLKASYKPYKDAYDAHKDALERHAARGRLLSDILWAIFLAGLGGGAIQQVIKGTSLEVTRVAMATAVGDIAKYEIRLLGERLAGHGPGGGSTSREIPMADPTKGAGAATEGVGFSPDVWLAENEKAIVAAGKALKSKCVDLKKAISNAWAADKTDLMDQDPIDIIAPYVRNLKQAVNLPVKKKEEFSRGLWENWLKQFAWKSHSPLDPLVGDPEEDVRLVDNVDDDKLMSEIRSQCGPGSQSMIDAAIEAGKIYKRTQVRQEQIKNRSRRSHGGAP